MAKFEKIHFQFQTVEWACQAAREVVRREKGRKTEQLPSSRIPRMWPSWPTISRTCFSRCRTGGGWEGHFYAHPGMQVPDHVRPDNLQNWRHGVEDRWSGAQYQRPDGTGFTFSSFAVSKQSNPGWPERGSSSTGKQGPRRSQVILAIVSFILPKPNQPLSSKPNQILHYQPYRFNIVNLLINVVVIYK